MMFRKLRADEIEVRVGGVSDGKGGFLLLYKDARCDMKILDETIGSMNWMRGHEVIDGQLFCNVSIWDSEKLQWITKQDVGVESFSDSEKGRASDSFKRACFNFGIGRELYTAPFIWISDSKANKLNWKYKKFKVKSIDYDDKGNISQLSIDEIDGNNLKTVFNFGKSTSRQQQYSIDDRKAQTTKERSKPTNLQSQLDEMFDLMTKAGFKTQEMKDFVNMQTGKSNSNELTLSEVQKIIELVKPMTQLGG